jgi:hypothetical protein
MPLFFVFFNNLINGGRKFKNSKINSFEDLAKRGFPCYIESIKYDPDISAGFFEFDGYLYPKNIKLSLTLNYESESLFDSDSPLLNNKTILPFTNKAEISKYDSGLFPFHADMSVLDMNSATGNKTDRRKSSFLFLASAKNITDFDKVTKKLTTKESMPRYVVFDLFLEQFSRDLQYSYIKAPAGNSTVFSKVQTDTAAFKQLKHSLKINLVAENLSEAKKNAAKIQYLARMYFKTFYEGGAVVNNNPLSLSKSELLQNILVYMPAMIERPSKSKSKSTELKGMIQRSLPMYLEEFSLDMNVGLGFFQEGGKLYPKSLSVSLGLLYLKNDLIVNYNADYLEDDGPQWTMPPLKDSSILDGTNTYLFPYNRKTVKIGGV